MEEWLSVYRVLKPSPGTVAVSIQFAAQTVMAGLWMGCLPPEVEPGRYTQTPYQREICKLCSMWRTKNTFSFFCPALQQEWNLLFKADRTTHVPLTLWPCYVVGPLESKLGSLKKARFVLSLRSLPCRKKVNPLNLQLPFPYLIPWPWAALSL